MHMAFATSIRSAIYVASFGLPAIAAQTVPSQPTRGRHVHKRGEFPAVDVGGTHARGTMEPVNLKADDPVAIEDLFAPPAIQRMVKFANGGHPSNM